jgi:hypothetical protein
VRTTSDREVKTNKEALEVYLREYDKLAKETTSRIGFRDNLLYVTLASYGAIVAFAITRNDYRALFALPLVSAVLGLAYLSNDAKVSQIGKYIREILEPAVRELVQRPGGSRFFQWQWVHRNDERRRRRKKEQLFLDEMTFVGAGAVALVLAHALPPGAPSWWWILTLGELSMLVVIGIELWVLAGVRRQVDESQTG